MSYNGCAAYFLHEDVDITRISDEVITWSVESLINHYFPSWTSLYKKAVGIGFVSPTL